MKELFAVTPIDGRYSKQTEVFSEVFSEYGLIKHRLYVEVLWLLFLLQDLKTDNADESEIKKIQSIYEKFEPKGAYRIKEIEKTTNHDLKAVEYYIKEKLEELKLSRFKEWVHFGLTSEDINNTAYSLMFKKGLDILKKYLRVLLSDIEKFANEYKNIPFVARTHGQIASPTTLGKEFINFAYRIKREIDKLDNFEFEAKLNGATGNFNALVFAYPEINWIEESKRFVSEILNLKPVIFTTQINSYNHISEFFQILIRVSTTVNDLNRDFWGYISLGYFTQKVKENETGSSTMPHKVNPIDFENSEGNLGMAVSLMQHLSVKLLISRYQRDLSDSTALRNSGAIFSYIVIALKSTIRGLGKIYPDIKRISKDFENNYELLSEGIQTIMRFYKEKNPYEKLKKFTRGRKISKEDLNEFIDTLKLPEKIKIKLKNTKPDEYTGVAADLVDIYFKNKEKSKK